MRRTNPCSVELSSRAASVYCPFFKPLSRHTSNDRRRTVRALVLRPPAKKGGGGELCKDGGDGAEPNINGEGGVTGWIPLGGASFCKLSVMPLRILCKSSRSRLAAVSTLTLMLAMGAAPVELDPARFGNRAASMCRSKKKCLCLFTSLPCSPPPNIVAKTVSTAPFKIVRWS